MKTNDKHDRMIKDLSNNTPRIEDQKAASRAWQKSMKATAAASVISLAILGAGQIPLQTLLGESESSVQAQTRAGNRDDQALNEYFRWDFNYADAKVLAAYWGGKVDEAKIRMGHKLLNLKRNDALRYIREARGLALERSSVRSQPGYGVLIYPVDYTDGGYEYADVEVLAKYWKQSPSETKFLMDTLLISGKDRNIQAALNDARSRR